MTALEKTWADPPGCSAASPRSITSASGVRFIVTAFVSSRSPACWRLLMRLQLARPDNDLIGPDLYNQLFTMHGTTMMFLFAVPVMEAMGVYLVPLMVGTRNIAFPRLNAFSYWMLPVRRHDVLFVAFLLNIGPGRRLVRLRAARRARVSRRQARRRLGAADHLHRGRRRCVVAVEIIVTVFKLRAPGMSLDRMPLFVWAMLVTAFMVIFAMPAVMLGEHAR